MTKLAVLALASSLAACGGRSAEPSPDQGQGAAAPAIRAAEAPAPAPAVSPDEQKRADDATEEARAASRAAAAQLEQIELEIYALESEVQSARAAMDRVSGGDDADAAKARLGELQRRHAALKTQRAAAKAAAAHLRTADDL